MTSKLSATGDWWVKALIPALITLLVLGSLTGTFLWSVSNGARRTADAQMQEYAQQLKEESAQNLSLLTDADTQAQLSYLIRPNVKVILYRRRADGTASYHTADPFLNEHHADISSSLNKTQPERIENYEFFTYSFSAQEGYYVKLLISSDLVDEHGAVGIYIWYLLGALIACAAIYLVFTYLQGRPIYRTIEQQKNFINDMSHEIRTPLTVIKGNLENIMQSPDSRIMDVSQQLESTLSEVDHITALSQNLLSIVSTRRAEAHRKTERGLGEMISGVLEIYSEIISAGNRTLIASIDEAEALVDSEKIKQLLIILLDNAIKYTREGDKIKVSFKRVDGGIKLTVSDTGIGIAEGDEEKIFERFYRGENAKNQQGTGLGLSIAKSIVEQHNGKMTATRNIPTGLIIAAFIPSKS